MKKILNLALLLVLTLTLTFTFTSSFASGVSLPECKNYIDYNDFTFSDSGVEINTGKSILVKANTDYTLTLPVAYAHEYFIIDGNEGYLQVSGNGGTLLTIFLDSGLESEGITLDGGNIYASFNTGSSTVITNLDLDLFDGTSMTWALANGSYLQLEEGSLSTAYELYIATVIDDIAPIINGGTGVWLTNVDSPDLTATIKASLTATDETDGVIGITIVSDLYVGNENTLGDYNITFRATDSSGNSTDVVVIVRVVDIVIPTINLNGSTPQYVEFGTSYSELGAVVNDNYDSGLTAVITGTVNDLVLGTYTINYNATDSTGNVATTVDRSVIVRDTIAPVISIVGDSTVYVEFGDNYTELGATYSDAYDVDGAAIVSGSVNVGVLGTYTISYNITDSNGNVATTITRSVVVRDTTAPVIVGSASQTWNVSLHYSLIDLLALYTSSDIYDGVITDSIEVITDTFSANSDIFGSWTVVLRSTDTEGNYSELTITVNIIDDMAPLWSTTATLFTLEYANAMTQQDIIDYFNNQ